MTDLAQDNYDERFARTRRLLGDEGLARLHNAHVVIIGLGAVGGFATEALARAGVGHLRLVDFDDVRLSNINRQILALQTTLGRPKVELARERILAIHPRCHVETCRAFAHADTLPDILTPPLDLIVDAIDSLSPKIALLAAAHERGIPVVSSMGAALRRDPAKVRIGPLDGVHHCRLARKVRKALRQRGIPLDFPCVYSTEPQHLLPPDALDRHAPTEPNAYDRGRPRRTLGSLPTLTGIFGLMLAHATLETLLQNPQEANENQRGRCYP